MKPTNKFFQLILVLSLFCSILSACNIPQLKEKFSPAPTETPAPVESTNEEEMMLINNNASTSGDTGEMPVNNTDEGSDMMLHNNSDSAGAPSESAPENEEELPLITNPGRSSVDYPKTASLGFRSSAALTNSRAQVSSSSDDELVIKNDHNIVYPETQSVIQKSVPSGQLAPLSYIPPTSLASGQSIMFSPGATSAVISGYVQAGGYVSYNLYAFANQNFLVLLSSDSGTSVLGISDVYGNVFLNQNQRQTSYNMYLPRTATYYVNVYSQGYAENFTLQIFIPARVTIPQGQTSVSMSGSVAPYSVVSYTAYMYAGQTARIDDYSGPTPNSFLRVSGLQTNQVYMDYTAYSPSWYAVVPVTQDYLIEVISIDQTSNYRLTVDVR